MRCPKCGHTDIQILTFNFPRGRCRKCNFKASLRAFGGDSEKSRERAAKSLSKVRLSK